MKKVETTFLCAVILFAAVFAAVTLTNSADIMAKRAAARHATTGAAGEARDVDVERIERLIREQLLSGHEASFYEPVDGAAPPVEPSGKATSEEPPGGAPTDSRR